MVYKKKKLSLPGADSGFFSQKTRRLNFSIYNEYGGDGQPGLRSSVIFVFVIFSIAFIFLGRLFVLTVVQGDKNRQQADDNRIKLVSIEAKRGKMMDRFGRVVVESSDENILTKGESATIISSEQAKDLENLGLALS